MINTEGTKVWAHRGASGYAPENTLEAFKKAEKMKADGVELDVQLTKDGELVVIHDETVDRVSGEKGFVKDYTLKELKRLNVSKHMPSYDKKTRIPTLDEVFDLLKNTEMTINIELKTVSYSTKIWRKGYWRLWKSMICLTESGAHHSITSRLCA